MSDKPLVTMVMPTYNRPRYVLTAVRCFLQQTYENKELIIIDDSEERMEVPSDSRIEYVRLGVRTPTGTKRNAGAVIANGDIIASLDDDDWSHPHRLEDQVGRLLKTGKAVTGYCATVRFDEVTKTLYRGFNNPPYFVSGTSQCYLRSWWLKHPFPDASYGEDSWFSREARLADQLAAADPGKMLVARQHGGNTEVISPKSYKKLTPEDVSEEFFKSVNSSILSDWDYMMEPHRCSRKCLEDMRQQAVADVGQDYKVASWPEIKVR